MRKDIIAWVVKNGGAIGGLVLMWQSVRFCMGNIGAPGVDYFFATIRSADTFVLVDWYMTALHYLLGVMLWVGLGAVINAVAEAAAGILVVGLRQFCEEQREAGKEARRLERIEAARERRGELRRKASESKSGLSVTSLVIGIIIGSTWL